MPKAAGRPQDVLDLERLAEDCRYRADSHVRT